MNFFGGEFRAPQTLLGDNVQAKNISAPLNHTGIMIPGFFIIPIRRVAPSSFFNSTECFCPYGCACHGWIPLSPRKIWCSQGSIPASWPQYQTIHPPSPPPGPTGDIANDSFHCCLLDQTNCKIKTTYIKEEGKSRCLSMFFFGGKQLQRPLPSKTRMNLIMLCQVLTVLMVFFCHAQMQILLDFLSKHHPLLHHRY